MTFLLMAILSFARFIRKALEEIRRCSGTQFDPELVENFVSLMEEELLKQAQ